MRIQKLQTFGDYLCGIEPPMLAYNVETRQYYSVAPSVEYSEQETESKDRDESDVRFCRVVKYLHHGSTRYLDRNLCFVCSANF